jgi:hypothetical protein
MFVVDLGDDFPAVREFQQGQIIGENHLAVPRDFDLGRRASAGDVQRDDLAVHLGLGGIEIGGLFPFFYALDPGVDGEAADFLPVDRENPSCLVTLFELFL